jgi:antitoxin component YwqK of YwqJK toxin-antitoxin module
MKKILLIFILTFTTNVLSQVEFDIYFFDECKNEIKKIGFELIDSEFNLVELKNNKIDSIGIFTLATKLDIKNGDYGASVYKTLNIKEFGKYSDTINVSKIRFVTSNALHDSYWKYYNCSKLCNGIETDFYPNGNMRLQGSFINGKPKEIKKFRKNGTLETQEFYEIGYLKYRQINYFDSSGKLFEYEIYKNKKRKNIIKTYNEKGKLVKREIERFYI